MTCVLRFSKSSEEGPFDSGIEVEVLLLLAYATLIRTSYNSVWLLLAYEELSLKFSQVLRHGSFLFISKMIKLRLRTIKKFAREQPNGKLTMQISN